MTALIAIPFVCYAVHLACTALQPRLIRLIRS